MSLEYYTNLVPSRDCLANCSEDEHIITQRYGSALMRMRILYLDNRARTEPSAISSAPPVEKAL